MSFPYVSVRFGLILEAYCRGSLEHLSSLTSQLEYLKKMKEISETIRQRKDRDKARMYLQEQMSEIHVADIMTDVINPLDPTYRLKSVR